jgi:hypothetical protein
VVAEAVAEAVAEEGGLEEVVAEGGLEEEDLEDTDSILIDM